MTREEKYRMMTQTPVERLVCRMAVPTITSMLISAMYNMADTYFVGQIGTSATAGVGVAFSLMAMIQAVGFFFGHGSGNYISRQLGAQNVDEAAKMAATGAVSSWLAGALLFLTGSLMLEPLALLLGATDTILPHAVSYIRFILMGAPWMCCSLTLNNLLRLQGSAFYGMIGMTSGAILNVGLDPLFIFVFDLGVGGAALATMISQTVSCILLLVGCLRGGNVPVRLRNFSPRLQNYKEILRGGLPSLFRQGLGSVAIVVLNQTAGGFGDAAIAAMSVVNRVAMFASSAIIGFGQGFQPVCGFNYGAKLYSRVRRAFWFCVQVATVFMLGISICGFVLAPQVIALFRRDDPEVIRIGAFALRMVCVVFPLLGWIVINNMMLQTMGKAFKASILAVSRQGIFLIVFLWALVPRLGILGMQVAQPAADVVTFLMSVPLGVSVLRELREDEALHTLSGDPSHPKELDIPDMEPMDL